MHAVTYLRALMIGLAAWGAVFATPGALADPTVLKSGAAVLPTSGLRIDLPGWKGGVYNVSGSWALTNGGATFDTRDIVDEVDQASGQVVAGNWVLIGYFDAGGCSEVLAAQTLDKPWTQEATLWGQSWKIRGGVYSFDNGLGRRPAALLCRTNAASQSLLLYRYLTSQAETLSQEAVMNDVKQAAVLALASHAYDGGSIEDSAPPLHRTDVRNRGSIQAQRTVTLEKTGLTFTLPDDGYVWLARSAGESDMLDRMMPSLPDISVEVMLARGTSCDKVVPLLAEDQALGAPGRHAPPPWMLGPTLLLDDNQSEATVCYSRPFGALLAGVVKETGETDFEDYRAVLEALTRATPTQ